MLDIILGTRVLLGHDEKVRQPAVTEHDSNSSDDDISLASCSSSATSFQEAAFRISSVTASLDSLYKIASRIRSPRNRQQRSTQDLYKHIPESQRAEYIQNQQQVELSLVVYVQRQQLTEWFDYEKLQELGFDREELLKEYASASHWLMVRAGMANARRKQQFRYWKKHAQLLGRDVTEEAPIVAPRLVDIAAVPQPAAATSRVSKPVPARSMATSATKIDPTMMRPDDMGSVISHRSSVSTVTNPQGESLDWPPAPSHLMGQGYFSCPYCGILCPDRYLSREDWR